MTLIEVINEWLFQNHQYNIKENTLLRYRCSIDNHIIPLIGNRDAETITSRDLQKLVSDLKNSISFRTKKPLSNSTINNIIIILKLMFRYAFEFEIISNNPALKIRSFPIKKEEKVKTFTKEEQIKIEKHIEKLQNDEYFCYILVLYTGLRMGEMQALTWSDVNLTTGIITVNKTKYHYRDELGNWVHRLGTPKSDKSNREIPIPLFLKEKLRVLKRKRISKNVIVKNDGSLLDDKLITYRYKKLLKACRIKYLNFHCLRHTFATRALEKNLI